GKHSPDRVHAGSSSNPGPAPVADRLRGQPLLRPSARPGDAVRNGDVGALLVLRAAPPPGALHGRRAHRGRLRPPARPGVGHRGHLRGLGVPRLAAGRLGGGPAAGPAARHLHRRGAHHGRAPLHRPLRLRGAGHGGEGDVLPGADPDRAGHGAAQAEHLRHRGRPVPRGRRAARRGLLHLLHGDQHRRLLRPADHGDPGRVGG
ncbi:MAG: Di-tripeptide/cation symporter, partial [uncultured Gemmatimonadetes bacterium]